MRDEVPLVQLDSMCSRFGHHARVREQHHRAIEAAEGRHDLAEPRGVVGVLGPVDSRKIIAASSQAKTPDRPADDAGNRFSFVRVDDGFLRFDLKTGQVAYCNPHSDGWGCQAVPENRSALEREVGKLKDEVAALKRQIDSLREPPPPPRPPAPIPAPSAPPVQGDMTRDVPGHDDIARARAALHGVWQRLVEAIVGFKNDVMRKS